MKRGRGVADLGTALESRLVVPVQQAFRQSRFTGSGFTMKRRSNATAIALLLSMAARAVSAT
jgi:hypothetical protein